MVASAMNKDVSRLPHERCAPPACVPNRADPCADQRSASAPIPRPGAARRSRSWVPFALALALAACSSPMDKHPDIKLNPHPVQRYELTATVDAPGPFDSVTGYVSYDVTNVECVPRDAWEGARNVPSSSRSFEMTRVDAHTWKGYFYRDLLRDEDYFGLGVCHWDLTNALPVFAVHDEKFNPAATFAELLAGPQVRHFSKADFFNRSLRDGGAMGYSDADENVKRTPDHYFSISVTVKEDDR